MIHHKNFSDILDVIFGLERIPKRTVSFILNKLALDTQEPLLLKYEPETEFGSQDAPYEFLKDCVGFKV